MLWFKQKINIFEIIVGVHDLNTTFCLTKFGNYFINSSFGIHPFSSLNLPASIFPVNTLGIIIKTKISESFSIKTAVYDGRPGDRSSDKYNTNFTINKKEGFLSTIEMEYIKLDFNIIQDYSKGLITTE